MGVENEHFVDEALRLVDDAERRGIQLRILGSLAYRLHCPENLVLFDKMDRDLTDIDLAGKSDQAREIRTFVTSAGYIEDTRITMSTEGARYYFEHPESHLGVDVFLDELFFCHPIPLRARLDLDSPTIPLADLVLEKMQIVEINLKDIKDTVVLLREHDVGDATHGRETVDGAYIAALLSDDWGFYYTVINNLQKTARMLREFEAVPSDDAEVVDKRLRQLIDAIESAPKSRRWKLRAKIGTRKRWYQEVGEKDSTF